MGRGRVSRASLTQVASEPMSVGQADVSTVRRGIHQRACTQVGSPRMHPQDAGRLAAAFCRRYCYSAYFSSQAAGTAAPARLSRTCSCLRSSPASPGLHQEQHCRVRPSARCSPTCRFSTCRRCNMLPGQVQGTGPLKAHGH